MGIIRQMPEQLANQIAAGEVVERPASVVKELVENAIDARSTKILIELKEAGIQLIRISDDGIGMEQSDLLMSVLPHATSKIYDVHDLFQIQSLGFRGEALASIASVSKMTIESTVNQMTGTSANQGYFIKVHGSEIVEEGVTAPRPGTVMTVESLFYNTPARLKHLSSLKTEIRHILNFVQQIALAYPMIRFTLINDGSQIFSSYGTGDLRQAIANVYQPSIARQLIPIAAEDEDFIISGYVSPPQLTRTSKYYIHWLINGRVIQSYPLTQMLLKAYGRQLMIGRYPIAIINIELDPQLVDVNVHPTKQTVRLSKESELGALLTRAVNKVLEEINPVPQLQVEDVPGFKTTRTKEKIQYEDLPFDLTARPTDKDSQLDSNLTVESSQSNHDENNEKYGKIDESTEHYDNERNEHHHPIERPETSRTNPEERRDVSSVEDYDRSSQEFSNHQATLSASNNPDFKDNQSALTPTWDTQKVPFYDLRYVGQIHGTYLIAESEEGFYLIDQHAAQEKIRYERLMKNEPTEFDQQHLLLPFVFHFSPAEAAVVESLIERFEALGLSLSSFGPNTYQLESYPNWLNEDQVEKTVHDLVTLLDEEPNLTVNQLLEKSIIMQSCRGAIKANHYLSEVQAQALIREMADLEDPYHCPHGRPVFVEFNQTTLEKLFKRIMDAHESGHRA